MSAEARRSSQDEAEARAALARLEADGWIERHHEAWRTTRRWQQAMARAAVKLYEAGDTGQDLRVPIALALFEIYQANVRDELLAELVEAMLPIEATSLGLAPTVSPLF